MKSFFIANYSALQVNVSPLTSILPDKGGGLLEPGTYTQMKTAIEVISLIVASFFEPVLGVLQRSQRI
jgi:hypothetical protein